MSNDRSRNRLSERMDDDRVPIGGLLLRKSRSMLLRVVVNDDVLVADGLMVDDMVVDVYRVLTPDVLDAVDES